MNYYEEESWVEEFCIEEITADNTNFADKL